MYLMIQSVIDTDTLSIEDYSMSTIIIAVYSNIIEEML